MKRLFLAACLLVCSSLPALAQAPTHEPGTLLSMEKVHSLSMDSVRAIWDSYNAPKAMVPVNYAVDIYEVVYATKLPDGSPRKASGLYYVPQTTEPTALLGYGHGTTIVRDFRPGSKIKGERLITLAFACDGYRVAMPDYMGLAKGDGFHPYRHAETEAQAFVDFFRSAE